jgi:DNA polymerase-3 subunit delta
MRAFSAAIQDKQFSPAYYLFGEDEYRKEDALRALLDAAVDPATRDFNLDLRKGADLDAEALASLVSMPPMMAERRVVVIRDVAGLKKDARAALERYLEKPAADVLLVLTAPADAKADSTLSHLAEPVDIPSLKGDKIPKWIQTRAQRLGCEITDAATELLQSAIGTNLTELSVELDKLASYVSGGVIDDAAVAAVVGVKRDETLGQLLDAIAARDTRLALALMPAVLQQPKVSGVYIIMALTTQMLAFGIALSRGARQYNDYMNILKSGSSNLVGRAWGEAVSAWMRNVNKWTLPQVDHALAALLQTDLALKSSRVSSEEQILSNAILSICGGGAPRRAS